MLPFDQQASVALFRQFFDELWRFFSFLMERKKRKKRENSTLCLSFMHLG